MSKELKEFIVEAVETKIIEYKVKAKDKNQAWELVESGCYDSCVESHKSYQELTDVRENNK